MQEEAESVYPESQASHFPAPLIAQLRQLAAHAEVHKTVIILTYFWLKCIYLQINVSQFKYSVCLKKLPTVANGIFGKIGARKHNHWSAGYNISYL